MSLNPFHYMNEGHINTVFDELEERFGFPKKVWKKKFNDHLGEQKKSSDTLSVFLTFGNAHINGVLNGILARHYAHETFNNLVSYVIKRSPEFQRELNKGKQYRR